MGVWHLPLFCNNGCQIWRSEFSTAVKPVPSRKQVLQAGQIYVPRSWKMITSCLVRSSYREIALTAAEYPDLAFEKGTYAGHLTDITSAWTARPCTELKIRNSFILHENSVPRLSGLWMYLRNFNATLYERADVNFWHEGFPPCLRPVSCRKQSL